MGIRLPGGKSRMQLLPMASSPDGLISARVCGHHEDPRLGGAHHNQQRECHTRPWVLAHQCVTCWGGGGQFYTPTWFYFFLGGGGTFQNFLFHAEHFEYTHQAWGFQIPFIIHHEQNEIGHSSRCTDEPAKTPGEQRTTLGPWAKLLFPMGMGGAWGGGLHQP